ncbi:unnamed protein product [Schistosoma rodhaini]|uniref:Uncharacterized protein n=1 Tax=Schistosoma rodhaini TaxID=6188 RepID=A0AA85G311_9TREM|nr:unnamed protein product [Schistosoma rodhaini]
MSKEVEIIERLSTVPEYRWEILYLAERLPILKPVFTTSLCLLANLKCSISDFGLLMEFNTILLYICVFFNQ